MNNYDVLVLKQKPKFINTESLKPNEVGCYNCTRWRTGSKRCDSCVKFSEFKNIDTLNAELKEKGLDYLCVSSIERLRNKQRKGL